MRDYRIVSPSIGGIIQHGSLVYEGIQRPDELLRIMDGPAAKSSDGDHPSREYSKTEIKVIEQYFQDLYGVFMKKLSQFAVSPDASDEDTVKLQAFLQELVKIKKLMRDRATIEH